MPSTFRVRDFVFAVFALSSDVLDLIGVLSPGFRGDLEHVPKYLLVDLEDFQTLCPLVGVFRVRT